MKLAIDIRIGNGLSNVKLRSFHTMSCFYKQTFLNHKRNIQVKHIYYYNLIQLPSG